jgi:glycosidase
MLNDDKPTYEFHISLACRKRYGFEESIYGLNGNVILADYAAVQRLADRMNTVRDAANNPHLTVKAVEINIIALIEEILHLVVAEYRRQKNPDLFSRALNEINTSLGKPAVDGCLIAFIASFPPLNVMKQEIDASDYLVIPNGRTVSLEELLFLYLSNDNPAYRHYSELFDDTDLRQGTQYTDGINILKSFLKSQPKFGPLDLDLYELLKSPAYASPYSLSGQLEYIRQHWKSLLPVDIFEKLTEKILKAIDVLKEAEKFRGFAPGLEPLPDYKKIFSVHDGLSDHEPEKYSADLDWMPNLVLMAKNTYVWLNQLSQKYQRDVRHLDQIPDEELAWLAESGFTGLWLIGVWERSPASQRIKQICGNPEAVSSAYSLYEYRIADDLGGDVAYYNLKDRAFHLGIRIAVDMVPNHTGLFSKWVIEHPEWFIQLETPPYPAYTFNGPDLSNDPNIGIFIEDGYYSRRDAAVVFKRVDKRSGQVRYIYHGNDGTHMPWNDTAQLNFLLPDLREAVIQEILRVARYSSVIRFDAAMTLAKKHYQRLWFPQPGSGGDIPSRSWCGMNKAEFDRVFPVEFWREVVERVAVEAPDTLLLAEAFWLMEGYFVRSLGMHRVYNSAFMNMLKREENSNYRTVIRNLLEFDPQILKRFVNFMNNPDEEPAVAQFGKGDKYFGVCMMMSTLPGLPMFGHGQIEGFAEKYGMEYRRAYWNEHPDQDLTERHRREIFPLLKKRYLFSQVDEFFLYDVHSSSGHNQHDVFAYSNASGGEQALVVYNNRYQRSEGWLNWSVPFKSPQGNDLARVKLAEKMKLSGDGWIVFRDLLSNLEYIRPARQIWDTGLYLQLNGYQCHVFTNFYHQADPTGEYATLAARLKGQGTSSIEQSLWELRMEGFLATFEKLLEPLQNPVTLTGAIDNDPNRLVLFQNTRDALRHLLPEAGRVFNSQMSSLSNADDMAKEILNDFRCTGLSNGTRDKHLLELLSKTGKYGFEALDISLLYSYLAISHVLKIIPQEKARELLWDRLEEALEKGHVSGVHAFASRLLLEILTDSHWDWHEILDDRKAFLKFLERPKVLQYLGCNWHQNVFWFNKERFQFFVFCLAMTGIILPDISKNKFEIKRTLVKNYQAAARLLRLAEASEYNYHRFIDLLD